MKYSIILSYDDKNETIEIPYMFGEEIWHVQYSGIKDDKPFVVCDEVDGVWATNHRDCVGVTTKKGYHLCNWNSVFTFKQDAIDYCLNKMNSRKVKIKY